MSLIAAYRCSFFTFWRIYQWPVSYSTKASLERSSDTASTVSSDWLLKMTDGVDSA